VLIKVSSIRILKKWRYAAYERGNEMILASEQLKGMGAKFWVYLSLSTIFIWSSRYLLLNFLMAAFEKISFSEHIIIFGKQIILWVVMLISPTPGSSGTAEYFFPLFFQINLGDYTLIVNLLWRLFTYYPYLFLGAIFLPRWIKIVFFNSEKHRLSSKKG
jgi:glycosyltransferase 2 family protein